MVADKNGVKSDRPHCGIAPRRLCVFEFIYFARPDSVIDGSSVHVARQRAGAFLALEHPVQADIVIGVPDSGLDAALGYARQSGIPYGMGFIKNKYIGRTFISPTQDMRENEVNIKLNPIRSVVEGKRVVLMFDGAMSHANVYINGQKVGYWPYGYNSFHFDITKYLKPGQKNTLAVRLENLPESSRWYPGAGLYRNVHLIITEDA